MDVVDQALDLIDRRAREQSVAEIENKAGLFRRLVKHLLRARFERGPGRQERDRVEIALHRDPGAEQLAGFAEIDAPIDTDDVRARRAHQREQSAGIDAEENDRDTRFAGNGDRALDVWKYGCFVVGRAQLAAPAIEELQRLRSGTG